jgi:hypothetical protein
MILLCTSKIHPEPVDLTGSALLQGMHQSLAAEEQNTCTTAGRYGSRLPRSSSSNCDTGVLSPALLWRLGPAPSDPPDRDREKEAIAIALIEAAFVLINGLKTSLRTLQRQDMRRWTHSASPPLPLSNVVMMTAAARMRLRG